MFRVRGIGAMATRDEWNAARASYETGAATIVELARTLDVSHQAVSKARIEQGWAEPLQAPEEPTRHLRAVPTSPADVQQQALAAVPAPAEWDEERQGREAASAGLAAAVFRATLTRLIRGDTLPGPQMIRSLTYAYGEFINAAQLLSGANTETVGVTLDPGERTERTVALLATLRQRANAIEARSEEVPEVDESD